MKQILDSAQTFILKNARLLERHLFHFLFRDGRKESALAALLAYQNDDGGFGNALEPDKRTATSQPIDQEFGLHILDDLGFDTAIAIRLCDYLQTITTPEGGVPFVLPTVRDAPRANWWNTDEENPPASINPTASIAGLLHKHQIRHPWLDAATADCWQQIEDLQFTFAHDFLCAMLFLERVPDRARAERAFESLCRRLFDEATMQTHLDTLAQKQQEDGGWPISWTAVSPACELEYRGIVTIRALKTLQAYGYPE